LRDIITTTMRKRSLAKIKLFAKNNKIMRKQRN